MTKFPKVKSIYNLWTIFFGDPFKAYYKQTLIWFNGFNKEAILEDEYFKILQEVEKEINLQKGPKRSINKKLFNKLISHPKFDLKLSKDELKYNTKIEQLTIKSK